MMSGGTIDVQFSAIGVEAPMTDSTHCDMHFGGTGNVIKFTHSNVSSSSYGIMYYGGMTADFTYNNWFGNTIDVDTDQASRSAATSRWAGSRRARRRARASRPEPSRGRASRTAPVRTTKSARVRTRKHVVRTFVLQGIRAPKGGFFISHNVIFSRTFALSGGDGVSR